MTASDSTERRRAERLKLDEHLYARLDDVAATLLEVGLLGAMIEHTEPFDVGHQGRFSFSWDEEEVVLVARVTHSEVSVARSEARGETTYLTGIEFISSEDKGAAVLKRMISLHVMRSLERMKANARGRSRPVDDAMSLLSTPAPFLDASDDGPKIYISCRLDASGLWHRSEVLRPKQPQDGFTVAASYGEDEIAMLCESYEEGDGEARHMIRVCAEMSLAAGDVPPKSFV